MLKKILTLCFLCFISPLFAATPAASVISVQGDAWAKNQSSILRTLHEDDTVYSDEQLITAKKAKLHIKFTDGTEFNLDEETTIEISDYHYYSNQKEEGFVVDVLLGTFRFISGLIANNNPQAMTVNTPVATIGIRGTHVAAEVTSTSAKIILLEPKKDKPTSIAVSNQFGSVVVDKVGFGTEIPDSTSPPSPMKRMQLRTVNNLMRSIQNSQRMAKPTVVRPHLPY